METEYPVTIAVTDCGVGGEDSMVLIRYFGIRRNLGTLLFPNGVSYSRGSA